MGILGETLGRLAEQTIAPLFGRQSGGDIGAAIGSFLPFEKGGKVPMKHKKGKKKTNKKKMNKKK